jgi:hypothetical protein
LFVAYYAAAELGCHLALGWPLPRRVLDLFAEFRVRTNGLALPHGAGLLGALLWHGLPALGAAEKDAMRRLTQRGGPWSPAERDALLDYCAGDVAALERLLPAMLPEIDLPRALLRGRYMRAVARMEHAGVPVDVSTLLRLRDGWEAIQDRLIREVDARFGVFDGRTFKADRWARWLDRNGLDWPRLESGALALDDDTFREMARGRPDVVLIRELRYSLAQLRLHDLAVGADGRNRVMLSAFRATTGRNQPSNARFIFGPSCWLRFLIRPAEGRALVYVDWSGQEYGTAAALSRDPAMMADYDSGDPYVAFGRRAGLIPPGGTKATHPAEREVVKTSLGLGVMYGMGPENLARRIGRPAAFARELLRLHRETYPKFWDWSDAAVSQGMLSDRDSPPSELLRTVFGWPVRVGPEANPRSLRNFPCQANGAEMLRLACCLATGGGLNVCAPVHDAILVEGPAEAIEEVVARAQAAMAAASETVLSGFRLRTDAKVVAWPDRYMDPRGREMWDRVTRLLAGVTPADVRPPRRVRLSRRPEDPCGDDRPSVQR